MRAYLGGAVLLVLAVQLWGAQSVRRKLDTPVRNYSISEPTFVDALAAVASRFKIPIGVELVATPSVLQPVKRTWRKATVIEILTSLVSGEKGYRLHVSNGIVHIFQESLVHQRSNFLNTHVKRFQVLNVGAAVARLRVWEIVNKEFQPPKPLRPGPHGTITTGAGRFGDQTFSLDLHNTTVREILDRISLSSNYPIWVVAFAPGEALTPTGFRRTASPTTGKSHELGWEMLRWGEKPY